MKRLIIILFCFIMLMGCNKEDYILTETQENIVEFTEISHYGTTTGLCKLHYRVRNNNTIEIYGSYDANGLVIEHIPGLTFNISDESKQKIIDSLNQNEIVNLSETLDSGNGSVEESIVLFNEDNSIYKTIKGTSPDNIQYVNFKRTLFNEIPENEFKHGVELVVKHINDTLRQKFC